MRRRPGFAVLAFVTSAVLGGCQKEVAAPTDAGVCWQAVTGPNRSVQFNKVSSGDATLESCAAALEAMRLRFLALGGSHQDITGVYQGTFLFLNNDGVFTAQTINGPRFFFLGLTPDGRLATASALSTGR
jgi:hypothetical protein